ncbi:MAG: hypothetical protein JXR44_05860, partial [Thiotrichales bacterium]|nr:hypothetical protein [Thiotrichales bacterium]
AGSVDRVVDGVTDVVDGLVGTDTENLDAGLNEVTTDVQELLTGEQTLSEVAESLLGGKSNQGTAGAVDNLVDGLTDTLDGLLGTDTTELDNAVNDVTTALGGIVGGLFGGLGLNALARSSSVDAETETQLNASGLENTLLVDADLALNASELMIDGIEADEVMNQLDSLVGDTVTELNAPASNTVETVVNTGNSLVESVLLSSNNLLNNSGSDNNGLI